ncbi:hypothetical protein [Streptomyces sp. NPDC090025]|uniref:hypothetical protein n=1 Tax=Streptomyces sp. NPDC090025 TaxID=3365922 RepID=UPI0038394871
MHTSTENAVSTSTTPTPTPVLPLPRFSPTPAFRLLGLLPPPPDRTLVHVLPAEPGVDSVLRVKPPSPGGPFVLALDVRGRRDPARARGWAGSLVRLRERYGVPAVLLVVCADRATASWSAGPFTTGLGCWPALSLRPLVLGPLEIRPVTTAPAAAADLGNATFAALAHAGGSRSATALAVLSEALRTAAPETRAYCASLLEAGLGDSLAGATWRRLTGLRRAAGGIV